MFSCRTMGMNVKRRLYGVALPITLYETETRSMTVAEKRLNAMDVSWLRIICGVMHMDQARNEEVQRRTGVTKELAGQAKQCVLRWFGHMALIYQIGCREGEDNAY